MALSMNTIRNAKPAAKPYKLADEKGLFLLVQLSGGMLWRMKFRIDGRDAEGNAKKVEKKLGFGTYPEVSLKDARALRDDARALLAKGIDPAEKKRRDIHIAKVSAANSFASVARSYIDKCKREGRAEATMEGVDKSLARFEQATGGKDFKRFHREQAVAFKAKLAQSHNARTGERLSKTTLLSTMRDLRTFFWLMHLPGFKSHIAYADAHYFKLSAKDVTIARARREKRVPTREQVHHVLADSFRL